MAEDKIIVDDEKVAGVELSKEEKKRLKRQEKKLKKFGLKMNLKWGKWNYSSIELKKKKNKKKKAS